MSYIQQFKVTKGHAFNLSDHDPSYTGTFSSKKQAKETLSKHIEKLKELQAKLYASGKHSILIVLQAMDAAGKDGLIKHVMSGINPQGCIVHSFKHPSAHELARNYLWRHVVALPEKGMISIFNRSHYENVLICRVHPMLVLNEEIPKYTHLKDIDERFWKLRYLQISRFEDFIHEMGTIVIKIFLNVSKEEQKKRLIKRLDTPEKQWKFSMSDVHERSYWQEYMHAYEQAIRHTSSERAPWYIIPADHKWFSRVAVGEILVNTLENLSLEAPKMNKEQVKSLDEARKLLQSE